MSHKRKDGITIYEPEDFEGMRKAGKLAAECLDYLTPYVKVGVSTGELDDLAREFILAHGAVPSCLGYRGYPKPCVFLLITSFATVFRAMSANWPTAIF